MNERETFAALVLHFAPGVGIAGARRLHEHFGSLAAALEHPDELPRVQGLTDEARASLVDPSLRERAHREWDYDAAHRVRCLSFLDEAYPARMRKLPDAPLVLFYCGSAPLNRARVVSVVGTRRVTDYGQKLCSRFLSELSQLCPDVLVVSGLAYGVDISAHRAALDNRLDTVGVLAHGLDRIYPYAHRSDAGRMVRRGGLLTEYHVGTEPERQNFVRRNRIVAGMSDATVVVESAARGGSLITARLAGDYHRPCFAFPGPVGAPCSEGCNNLIRQGRAVLLQSAFELASALGWVGSQPTAQPVQSSLFTELSDDERQVVDLLRRSPEGISTDALSAGTGLSVQQLSTTLFGLEMKGLVRPLAGNGYQLTTSSIDN